MKNFIFLTLAVFVVSCSSEHLNDLESKDSKNTESNIVSNYQNNENLAEPEWGIPNGGMLAIYIGKASVHCTFPPCPCTELIGSCHDDPWDVLTDASNLDPWHIISGIEVENEELLHIRFEAEHDHDQFFISNEYLLTQSISEPLGYSNIILLPGEYQIDFTDHPYGDVYIGFTSEN